MSLKRHRSLHYRRESRSPAKSHRRGAVERLHQGTVEHDSPSSAYSPCQVRETFWAVHSAIILLGSRIRTNSTHSMQTSIGGSQLLRAIPDCVLLGRAPPKRISHLAKASAPVHLPGQVRPQSASSRAQEFLEGHTHLRSRAKVRSRERRSPTPGTLPYTRSPERAREPQ